ncbi:MAG: transposase ISSod12 protein [Gammaproteobacteria bacterium]|jgi:hypothetical protein|nr:transposase ISSod12 protein [Gammaproteobacteria bacterium]
MSKTQRICNWKDYNDSLIKRGEIIFSYDTAYLAKLFHKGKQNRGGIRKFSCKMYEYLLTVKVILRLPWRGTLGFVKGLLKEIHSENIELPHYAHASREANKLNLKIKTYTQKQIKRGLEIAFDSTGVNVYSTSGYHQRKYGKENIFRKRDPWKKIHLAVDLNAQQILSMAYTKSNVNDCEAVTELSQGIKGKVDKTIADGAYDTEDIHKLVCAWGATVLIPPATTSKAQHELKNKKPYKAYLK